MLGSMLIKMLNRKWRPLLKILDDDPGQPTPLGVLEFHHVLLPVPHPAVPHVHPLVWLSSVSTLLQSRSCPPVILQVECLNLEVGPVNNLFQVLVVCGWLLPI